jgi:hypothetical protein
MLRALAAAAVLVTGVSAADAARDTFGVGILRRDGIIIPFGAFDGRKWSANWPKPALDLTVPISLSAIPSKWWGPTPPLGTWQVTTANGASLVRVLQPDWVDVHCARQIGLRTDYRPPKLPPPPSEQPYPKDGLAVAPPHEMNRIEVVPNTGDEARALTEEMHRAFNEAERKTEGRHGHPVERRAREGVQPDFEAIYAWGQTPRIYYVEAARPYRQFGQYVGECAGIGFGTGWFLRDSSGVRTVTMVVDVLNCDRDFASYMLPLGVLRLNDRTFWLAQFSGYDHERYVVLEIHEKSVDVAVNSWGGAC